MLSSWQNRRSIWKQTIKGSSDETHGALNKKLGLCGLAPPRQSSPDSPLTPPSPDPVSHLLFPGAVCHALHASSAPFCSLFLLPHPSSHLHLGTSAQPPGQSPWFEGNPLRITSSVSKYFLYISMSACFLVNSTVAFSYCVYQSNPGALWPKCGYSSGSGLTLPIC